MNGSKRYTGDSSFLRDLGIHEEAVNQAFDPTQLFCSFCEKPVSRICATFGIKRFKVESEYKKVWDDPIVIETTTKVTATKATACPSCAHLIRPIMHKVDGVEEIKIRNSNGYDAG